MAATPASAPSTAALSPFVNSPSEVRMITYYRLDARAQQYAQLQTMGGV